MIRTSTDSTSLITDHAPPGCFKESDNREEPRLKLRSKPIDSFQMDSLKWDTLGQQYTENTTARDFEKEYRYLQFLGMQEGRHAGHEPRWISG